MYQSFNLIFRLEIDFKVQDWRVRMWVNNIETQHPSCIY